jgi:hypothetical protein
MVPPALWRHLGAQFAIAAPHLTSLRAMYRRAPTLVEQHLCDDCLINMHERSHAAWRFVAENDCLFRRALQKLLTLFSSKSTSSALFVSEYLDAFKGTDAAINAMACATHPRISRSKRPISTVWTARVCVSVQSFSRKYA